MNNDKKVTFVLPEISFHSRRDKSQALDMSNFLAQVMPKFTENFGMTFAKKWTNREPEICRNRNESTFRQNIGHSASFPGNNKATWAQSNNFNEKI